MVPPTSHQLHIVYHTYIVFDDHNCRSWCVSDHFVLSIGVKSSQSNLHTNLSIKVLEHATEFLVQHPSTNNNDRKSGISSCGSVIEYGVVDNTARDSAQTNHSFREGYLADQPSAKIGWTATTKSSAISNKEPNHLNLQNIARALARICSCFGIGSHPSCWGCWRKMGLG